MKIENFHLSPGFLNNKEWTGADSYIAAAWHRLLTGSGTDVDKLLLKHETAEIWFRKNINSNPRTGHQKANNHWHWQEVVESWE